ncbi:hypothetical protein RSOLAG1IB_04093 [Rhizoctonia solani AG-1 IB]|uniref:Uncharacterized protein n=1 Tax=Thanatephorus cucumeris (strain AG1-IB / isolate 7/3/14) TaxID=1108050 RepID=A0A0B7FVD5_THACB|nr:hypothetical protein RSOLAG1IB_04093 [Rhizoctonia solani AG-1 IB]
MLPPNRYTTQIPSTESPSTVHLLTSAKNIWVNLNSPRFGRLIGIIDANWQAGGWTHELRNMMGIRILYTPIIRGAHMLAQSKSRLRELL